MKKIFSLLPLIAISLSAMSQPKLSLPPDKVEWFKDAKFGMFIHWGLYSILEGSYNGHTLPDTTFKNGKAWYAEWIQARLEVPSKEYKALAKTFNPINFNAEEWILEAKNAGMRYFVITAKHHDGFALWDSKVSDFNIMNTPYKRDVLAELVEACKKHDIKYGFYYSHWQDWEYKGGAMPEWEPWVKDKDFEQYWQKKSLPQVKELIDKFNPDLLWFDTWDWETHITEKRRDELIALVRANSDKCLINGRISYNNPGQNIDFLEMHDNQYPSEVLGKPWQTPATMVHSWGWHAKDYNWKSASQMTWFLAGNAAKGGNYLLNVGPKADGLFPAPAKRRLREIGAWMEVNSEAIYGTVPCEEPIEKDVYITQKMENGKLNLYLFLNNKISSVKVPQRVRNKIKKSYILESGMPLDLSTTGVSTFVTIPESVYKDSSVQVVKIETDMEGLLQLIY